jgi:hypothetical protein
MGKPLNNEQFYGILTFDFNNFYRKFVELENALTYEMTSCQNTKQSKVTGFFNICFVLSFILSIFFIFLPSHF